MAKEEKPRIDLSALTYNLYGELVWMWQRRKSQGFIDGRLPRIGFIMYTLNISGYGKGGKAKDLSMEDYLE